MKVTRLLQYLACPLVELKVLMERGSGRPEIKVGLIDGPIAIDHPDLRGENIVAMPGVNGACSKPTSLACLHGTFVAGILHAKRGSPAPAICPDCTLLLRPILPEAGLPNGTIPADRFSDLSLTNRSRPRARYLSRS
jgi:subtilisin family serine protease